MDDIKAKIHALMSKTVAAGCTEEEAMMASKKVQELLNKYQLSLSDIRIRETKCVTGEYDTKLRSKAPVDWCVNAIGYFTDTKVWFSMTPDGWIYYKFFGLEHDVLIAEYIIKICDWAIIYAGEDFKSDPTYLLTAKAKRARVLKEFRTAMAYRISKRLRQMKDDQNKANASTGRDLVVVKMAVVTEEFAKVHGKLRETKGQFKFTNAAAYHAGTAAGDRVAINPGVGAQAQERLK